jgi:hypothetical protein
MVEARLNDNTNMDATERVQAAAQFLLQSPPGEINDVLNGMLILTASPASKDTC